MELASSELILALIPSAVAPPRIRVRRNARAQAQAPRTKKPGRARCTCGKCRQCAEDQRWERIFREKFADPDYYTTAIPRMVSPLVSC
jgi:hypothetical protein